MHRIRISDILFNEKISECSNIGDDSETVKAAPYLVIYGASKNKLKFNWG